MKRLEIAFAVDMSKQGFPEGNPGPEVKRELERIAEELWFRGPAWFAGKGPQPVRLPNGQAAGAWSLEIVED